jgi:lysophospholipase L1-like esterase
LEFKIKRWLVGVLLAAPSSHGQEYLPIPSEFVTFIVKDSFGEKMNIYTLRDGLSNSTKKFQQEKTGRVVCLGGSITTSKGWRELIWDFLKKTFPQTAFDFIDAGIGGTDSAFGAMRLEADVFKNGPVDLLFLEFAVNDGGLEPTPVLRAMEGIIRHARKLNPKLDIPMLYFADQDKINEYNAGKIPSVIQTHDKVAQYYQLSTLNLAREITDRIRAGEFTWEQFSGDSCHPNSFGHGLYAQSIEKFLTALFDLPGPTPIPTKPLDPFNYGAGRFISLDLPRIRNDWTRIPQWDTAEPKCNYDGAVDVLAAEKPLAALTLDFTGSAVGIYGISGFDAGTIEFSLDHKDFTSFDFFDSYCLQFHRPVHHLLATELPPGPHTLTLKVAGQKNPQSKGHAIRILKFTAN